MTPLEQIYLSAVRYALGRMTYVVGITCDYLKGVELSEECRNLILREIGEAQDQDGLGHKCDERDWLDLKEYLLTISPVNEMTKTTQ